MEEWEYRVAGCVTILSWITLLNQLVARARGVDELAPLARVAVAGQKRLGLVVVVLVTSVYGLLCE